MRGTIGCGALVGFQEVQRLVLQNFTNELKSLVGKSIFLHMTRLKLYDESRAGDRG